MAKKTTAKRAKAKKSAKKKANVTGKRSVKRQSSSAAVKALEKLISPLSEEQIRDLVTLGSIVVERRGPCMRIPKPTRLADNKWEVTTDDLATGEVTPERAGPCMRIPRTKRVRD